MEIVLASGSPRRRQLLTQMGVPRFRVVLPDIDENMDRDMPAGRLVETISAEKAASVSEKERPETLIVAADTVVCLDGAVLGKPRDDLAAFQMLCALSGCQHQVYTGFTVSQGGKRVTRSVCTDVTFRELSDEEIETYIKTGEPKDKAGGYGIQGIGSLFVTGIQGDYFNVMGLPVCELGQTLKQFGVDCLRLATGIRAND